jgi:hypothetical protein
VGAPIAVCGLRNPAGARLRAAFRRLPSSAPWRLLRPPFGDRDLGERARIGEAQDHLSSIRKGQRSEEDTPLEELPNCVVPERLAAVFPPEYERAAVTPAGAAKPALPQDDRPAAARQSPSRVGSTGAPSPERMTSPVYWTISAMNWRGSS